MTSIVQYPDPILEQPCRPATAADTKDVGSRLSSMMLKVPTLYPGLQASGLAAPQIGESVSVLVVALSSGRVIMANPEVAWASEDTNIAVETCLSLVKERFRVERPVAVRVTFNDRKGVKRARIFANYEARVVQHEIDHVNGILINKKGVPA